MLPETAKSIARKPEGDGRNTGTRQLRLHLVGNAHLDPVWLWDGREGMNEALATCRAMVDMLNDFPGVRFIRGEAAVYHHIERYDPALFEEIRTLIAAGRWDVVGGNWIQPDTNLPSTEAMIRQFRRGKSYFREKFGVEVTAAWAADSFGHSAGMPDILAAVGLDSFAFTRPPFSVLPLRSQAFWWQGVGGARVLAYRPFDGWYASERANIGQRLDACLARAQSETLPVAAMFYGLGNHGGGPSRQHLREIAAWAAEHPEVEVIHSGLHAFFSDLRRELAVSPDDVIDTHQGELNFCLRGCSASVARFKYGYRKAEALLLRAEKASVVGGLVHGTDLTAIPEEVWDTLLFNAFHDILPGSSIERAYFDQQAQIGSVITAAQRAETSALTVLASRINTRAGVWEVGNDHPLPQPVLLWNPHPWKLRRLVEVEVSLDYRPMWQWHSHPEALPVRVVDGASGENLPFQLIREEHDSLQDFIWRRRALVPLELPPMGWTILQMGVDEKSGRQPTKNASGETTPGLKTTGTQGLGCEAVVGSMAIRLTRNGETWLAPGLQVRLYEDTWGAWGGMNEEPESWLLTRELERLTITDVLELESGPLRRAVWVRFTGKDVRSTLEVTLYLGLGDTHVEMRVRAFLADRGARMKLVMPATGANGEAEFAVPGGSVRRVPCGEVPGGRWVRAGAGAGAVGFASDALYGFDTTEDELRATIARTARYGSDMNRAPQDQPWQPCADMGEHVFRALLTPDWDGVPALADELEEPVVVLPVPGHPGESWRKESLLKVHEPVRLLALYAVAEGDLRLRLQNRGGETTAAQVEWKGRAYSLGCLAPGEIGTWRLGNGPDAPRRVSAVVSGEGGLVQEGQA
jgi:alpha-mannosidase